MTLQIHNRPEGDHTNSDKKYRLTPLQIHKMMEALHLHWQISNYNETEQRLSWIQIQYQSRLKSYHLADWERQQYEQIYYRHMEHIGPAGKSLCGQECRCESMVFWIEQSNFNRAQCGIEWTAHGYNNEPEHKLSTIAIPNIGASVRLCNSATEHTHNRWRTRATTDSITSK